MKIVWTTLAVHDLTQIRAYVSAAQSLLVADDILEQLARAVDNLPAYPQLGRSGRVKGTRELAIVGTPYIVVYRIKLARLEILAVIHSARRWPEKLS